MHTMVLLTQWLMDIANVRTGVKFTLPAQCRSSDIWRLAHNGARKTPAMDVYAMSVKRAANWQKRLLTRVTIRIRVPTARQAIIVPATSALNVNVREADIKTRQPKQAVRNALSDVTLQ
tara:strand:+ start:65 stop:421 length:357 start_codon:yes stop_codon:yes gene_type:complete